METTLHRCIDLAPDLTAAVDQAADLYIDRILSSGSTVSALDGIDHLRRMMKTADGRLIIMPGAGLTPETVHQITDALPVREVHAACATPVAPDERHLAFGFIGSAPIATSASEVRAMKTALEKAG